MPSFFSARVPSAPPKSSLPWLPARGGNKIVDDEAVEIVITVFAANAREYGSMKHVTDVRYDHPAISTPETIAPNKR